MMVFMGIWEPNEIPIILEEYEFISEDEASEIYKRLEEEDYEVVLRPIVARPVLGSRRSMKIRPAGDFRIPSQPLCGLVQAGRRTPGQFASEVIATDRTRPA
jgi:hypothetical protein